MVQLSFQDNNEQPTTKSLCLLVDVVDNEQNPRASLFLCGVLFFVCVVSLLVLLHEQCGSVQDLLDPLDANATSRGRMGDLFAWCVVRANYLLHSGVSVCIV